MTKKSILKKAVGKYGKGGPNLQNVPNSAPIMPSGLGPTPSFPGIQGVMGGQTTPMRAPSAPMMAPPTPAQNIATTMGPQKQTLPMPQSPMSVAPLRMAIQKSAPLSKSPSPKNSFVKPR